MGGRHEKMRRELKLTLKDLEAEFKISHALLSQCENGKSEFPLSYVAQFCEKHGVNSFWLIWGGELSPWTNEFFISPPVHVAEAMLRMADKEESPYFVGDDRKYTTEEQKKLYAEGLLPAARVKDARAVSQVDARRNLINGFLSLDVRKQFGLIFQAVLRWPLEEVERFGRIIQDYLENQKGDQP